MQTVVQKVDTQWNANEYQCILNDIWNRKGGKTKITSVCENVMSPFWMPTSLALLCLIRILES